MKTVLSGILSLTLLLLGCGSAMAERAASGHRLLYQGHGSLRIVTYGICLAGVRLGGKIGTKLAGKAPIIGGIILILIGIEIFVTGVIRG